jgi:hypothetical protein
MPRILGSAQHKLSRLDPSDLRVLRSRPRVAQDVAALDLDQMRGETWGIRENEIEERSNTEGAKRRRAAARKGRGPKE